VEPVAIEIHAEHAAALRAKQLNGHQADESQSDDRERFAKGRLRQPDAMERDCTQHGEGRGVVGHGIWNFRAQVRRHADHFRVPPIRRDAVTGVEHGDALTTSTTTPALQYPSGKG